MLEVACGVGFAITFSILLNSDGCFLSAYLIATTWLMLILRDEPEAAYGVSTSMLFLAFEDVCGWEVVGSEALSQQFCNY